MAAKSSIVLMFVVVLLVIASCPTNVKGRYDLAHTEVISSRCNTDADCHGPHRCFCAICKCIHNTCTWCKLDTKIDT
ncbi:hypothetical protein M5689_017620 [Euphorbia peplus]|nr:hypothetical protein M5689_017620 [Euphorbia peplus]